MIAVPAWHEALSGFDILAIILAVGTIATSLWLLPAADPPAAWHTGIRHRLLRVLVISLALLSLTSIAILLARAATISGRSVPELGGVVPLVLMQTDFGHAWLVRAGAVLLLWIACTTFQADRPQRLLHWALLACLAIVAYTRSATGHAGDHGDFTFAVWIDWLHLMAAGLWGGVVMVFIVAVYPSLRHHAEAGQALTFRRFSRIAGAGLGLAATTGVYKAWAALGGWQPLWTTHYGTILAWKLGLVLLMALLGATNRFRHVPALVRTRLEDPSSPARQSPAFRALALTCAAEALLMIVIVGVVALLVNAMPPMAMP